MSQDPVVCVDNDFAYDNTFWKIQTSKLYIPTSTVFPLTTDYGSMHFLSHKYSWLRHYSTFHTCYWYLALHWLALERSNTQLKLVSARVGFHLKWMIDDVCVYTVIPLITYKIEAKYLLAAVFNEGKWSVINNPDEDNNGFQRMPIGCRLHRRTWTRCSFATKETPWLLIRFCTESPSVS